MALDGKTIIKEEITDKDAYDAATATAATVPSSATSSTTSSLASASAVAAAVAASAISRRLKGNSNSSSSSNNSDKSSGSIGKDISSSSALPHHSSLVVATAHTVNGNGRDRERERERERICRTPPDSPPEVAARSVSIATPRSPMSPQQQLNARPQRNASAASPVVNGAASVSGTSPPPLPATQAASLAAAAAAAAAAHVEQARLVGKIRKFLGSLVQFSQELAPEISERVRALVLSLCSSAISVEEFRLALQEAINLPLRPYVMPLLKNSMALLQREILAMARATNQSALQYVTSNEQAVMEFAPHGLVSAEFSDIFIQLDGPTSASANGGNGSAVFKRRSSDSMMEHGAHNGLHEWSEYMASAYPPPSKRLAMHAHPSMVFDYSASGVVGGEVAASFMQRDERELRLSEAQAQAQAAAARHAPPALPAARPAANPNAAAGNVGAAAGAGGGGGGGGGEEEWKNIHTMLNCISAMVDKTKRAITILQQRGIEPQHGNASQELTPAAMAELRRQTEEKVAEFKRNAEDAVTQVKRQAVIEIQRAVVAAETRAAEIMTQERLRMEKFFMEMSRHSSGDRDLDNKSPSITSAQNGSSMQQQCWNCGRKATETCSGCNMARYCSASCQYRDWDSHHQVCGNSRASELSAKHLHAASSLRSAIATRSPPTPTTAAAAAAAAAVAATAHLQSSGRDGGTVAAAATAAAERVSSAGGGGGGGGGVNAAVVAATPSALVANGLGSK